MKWRRVEKWERTERFKLWFGFFGCCTFLDRSALTRIMIRWYPHSAVGEGLEWNVVGYHNRSEFQCGDDDLVEDWSNQLKIKEWVGITHLEHC